MISYGFGFKRLTELLNRQKVTMSYIRYLMIKEGFYDPSLIPLIKPEKPENYIKKTIFENDNYEVKLFKWAPNSVSSIHNHAENGCVFTILGNELNETLYDKNLNKIHCKDYYLFSTQLRKNSDIHKMQNNTTVSSYSLHIYSPPGFIADIYD